MALKKQVEEAFKNRFLSENNLELEVNVYEDPFINSIQVQAYKDDSEEVAYINLSYLPDSRTMQIHEIEVDRKFQGEGYGRVLVQFIENVTEELGGESVEALDSINDSFWTYMGYSEFGSKFKKYV
jgi:GNAT superfamily N-acetyltransferase